jgi:hypothetical protein
MSFQKKSLKMAAKFKKKGGKNKAEPGKVARKSKTILRRKLERQQKKEGKKRKKNQFYLDRFAAAKGGAETSQPLVKTQRKPTAAREEVHQRTQKQIQQLEKQQKEQRKGRPSILAFQIL